MLRHGDVLSSHSTFSSLQVNEIYHDPTLDVNIEVVTVKIIYMDKSTVRSSQTFRDPS